MMRSMVSYARSTFWIIGVAEILFGLYIAIAVRPHSASRPVAAAIAATILGLLVAALGAFSCLAARALRHKKRFARPLVALNSIFYLPFFRFGTIAGGVGLYWCCSQKVRDLEPLVENFEYQSKPGDGTQAWIQKAVSGIAIGVWLASFAAVGWWGRTHQLPSHAAINGLLVLFVSDWIMTFCHEVGHALAGWGADMSLAAFTVGPFTMQKRGGRWKFQFSLTSILTGGGSAASVPLHLNNLRRRMAFEIAGGPVASLLTALIP